jgi:FKBP-type peptidyl-prolyl cis-trans isomerase SlyD
MKIEKDTVVRIDYTLRDDAGEVLDSSDGGDPLEYLHGNDQIVPGLEAALAGRDEGESFKADVPPALGYGERDEEAVLKIPRDRFPATMRLEEGMELATRTPSGQVMRLRLTKVGLEAVEADMNHPLAGMNLHFDITVRGVRAATAEELEHRHSHGCGGHGQGCGEHSHGCCGEESEEDKA